MNINVYNYLLDNNLLEDFVANFSVKRKILNINKEIIVGKAYYKDNERGNGKGKKVYDRIPLNIYKWTYEVQSEYIIFGNKFTTTQQFSGISSDENEIPFGKKGNYYTLYSNLGGFENACYTFTGEKNIFSTYGKLSVLSLPTHLKLLLAEDQELAKFIYLYYTVLKDKKLDEDNISSIKRLFEITQQISKLEQEKQEIMNSLNDMSMIKK